jgi:single-strand DNA-binding protein
MSLNKVMLIGRVGADFEKRVTQNGSAVVVLSVATTDHYKDKSGNKKEDTVWHRVVYWNNLADIAEKYLKKGSMVYVEGSITFKEYTTKEGEKKKSYEVKGMILRMLSGKNESNTASNKYGTPSNEGSNSNQIDQISEDDIDPDDIPF